MNNPTEQRAFLTERMMEIDCYYLLFQNYSYKVPTDSTTDKTQTAL